MILSGKQTTKKEQVNFVQFEDFVVTLPLNLLLLLIVHGL